MSRARPVVPGRVSMVTRRCRDRRFLLRPDAATTQAFLYCLGLAAERFNIGLLGFVANSNHWHAVVVDRDGNLPAFTHFFHTLLAKHQNCLRGRFENFWSSEQTSVVHLVDDADVWDKLGYVLCNPVKDHLVDEIHHWPGASGANVWRRGGEITVPRPRRFFREGGTLPAEVTLCLARVPGCESSNADTYLERIQGLITAHEVEAADDRRARGIKVMGRRAVLRQHWDDRPSSREQRFGLSPRVAARNKWARIETLLANNTWQVEYKAARMRWAAGERDVEFPAGTYNLRRFACVKCVEWAQCPDPGG